MNKLPWLVGSGFAVASAIYLVTAFEWRGVAAILADADLVWLVGATGATLIAFLHLRALRWRLLLTQSGLFVPYGSVYLATVVAAVLGIAMPLQSGELTKVELLRRTHDVARLPGYSTLLVERALDLVCIVALGVVALLARANLIPNQGRLLTSLLALSLVVFALLVVVISRPPAPLRRLHASVRLCLRAPRVLLSTSIITLLAWLMVAAGWHSALRSIGVTLDAVSTLTLTAIVTLVSVASLVPGAVGVSEVSTALMLQSFEMPVATASAGALVIRAYGVLMLAIGLPHFAVWSLQVRRRRPSLGVRRVGTATEQEGGDPRPGFTSRWPPASPDGTS